MKQEINKDKEKKSKIWWIFNLSSKLGFAAFILFLLTATTGTVIALSVIYHTFFIDDTPDGDTSSVDSSGIVQDISDPQYLATTPPPAEMTNYFSVEVESSVIYSKGALKCYIANPTHNVYPCAVELVSGGNSLYVSDVIKPGQYIDVIPLELGLAPNIYGMDVIYNILDDDNNLVSKQIVEVTLKVEE